ncbi:IS66 family transposase [Rickettsia endosymbiont of Polydrusus tereticollis]|uniref:IS66 family transposase n=1 Tax=Rickettsia endosymbiont of Polydrusus tereticollis TaxID=3066251 RepID=UPI003132E33A
MNNLDRIIELEKLVELLEVTNQRLLQENKELKIKLIELEDRLNKNSSNSGLPSSKDIYRIEKKTKPKSDKNPGGQIGHKHNAYEIKASNINVDIIPEEESCKCGGSLLLEEKYRTHQKIEIPIIQPVVTEYRLYRKICTLCNRRYKAKLDNYRLLGKNAESIISSLSGFFNNSKREVQLILKQIFNLDISLGLISNTENRISVKLEDKYNELLNKIEESSYLHLDETSSNNKGNKHWCWVAANKALTVFKLANSRGQKVLKSFLPEYEGKVISDRYAAYNMFDSNKRQICLAHLRRDFKRFAYSQNASLAKIGSDLLYITDTIFRLYNLHKENKLDQARYLAVMQKIKKVMLYYLQDVANTDYLQAQRVANNILKSFDMIWLFLYDPQIELTNNLAERQIKHFVKYRKNSFFTWSLRGDRFLERIKSLYATSKLQGVNPFCYLLKLP